MAPRVEFMFSVCRPVWRDSPRRVPFWTAGNEAQRMFQPAYNPQVSVRLRSKDKVGRAEARSSDEGKKTLANYFLCDRDGSGKPVRGRQIVQDPTSGNFAFLFGWVQRE